MLSSRATFLLWSLYSSLSISARPSASILSSALTAGLDQITMQQRLSMIRQAHQAGAWFAVVFWREKGVGRAAKMFSSQAAAGVPLLL